MGATYIHISSGQWLNGLLGGLRKKIAHHDIAVAAELRESLEVRDSYGIQWEYNGVTGVKHEKHPVTWGYKYKSKESDFFFFFRRRLNHTVP